jgi:hypothetical protein
MKRYLKYLVMAGGLSLWLSMGGTPAWAMNRWDALSMIESGDNDAAIGRAGEVSRFQIKPLLWEKYGRPYPLSARTNPHAALRAAAAIMTARVGQFERHHHRSPTDFEYYVLWNAPAELGRPSRAVSARASRFCHLLES